jgi:hypothetical protein
MKVWVGKKEGALGLAGELVVRADEFIKFIGRMTGTIGTNFIVEWIDKPEKATMK